MTEFEMVETDNSTRDSALTETIDNDSCEFADERAEIVSVIKGIGDDNSTDSDDVIDEVSSRLGCAAEDVDDVAATVAVRHEESW